MAKTLGASVNAALRTIGEPSITSFTTTNELQNILIDDANESVHDLLEAGRYRWGYHRDAFATVANLTDGTVDATNASTTITSQDSDGDNADNFTNVAAGDWLRVGTDQTSYEVSTIDTGSSPDTLVLADAYLGSTVTTKGYVILRDTYSISITDLDEVIALSYGDNSATFGTGDDVPIVDLQTILDRSGGDLHKDTSGKPRFAAEISNDSSENPRWLLWPYPDAANLFTVWHTLKFTSNTTFATNMFGGDAPDIAYDAVIHHMRGRACLYDEDVGQADRWMQMYERARGQLVARENRQHRDEKTASVRTYRNSRLRRTRGIQGVSQILFDRV